MYHKIKAVLFFFILVGTLLLFPDLSAEKNKICLTMIVRNEEKIIERCLNSVQHIVDCISICDTGSTDNTVQIVEQYMQKKGIPGRVFQHEWQNFGHNRTLSVNAAQQMLETIGFSLTDTYLLLLDADMILEIDSRFLKDALKDDAYKLCQKNHSLSYYNTRLIRASLPWKCVGVTHEYWSCMVPSQEDTLNTLWINDRDDGGCKADKFERDVRLLTQGIREEPHNERYMFYLARSYHCLNEFDEAIEWYKKRIATRGWNEEVWYSKYMIGMCYEEMNQWDQALSCYLDAYQFNPERAEPLYQISKYYRLKEQYDLAYLFASQGAQIPYPSQQVLFISHSVYDYLFDEELSLSAYYTPFKQEGYAAVNRLMLKKNLPLSTREQAYKNILFYAESLKNVAFRPIKIALPPIREGFALCYNPMNPAIQKTKKGYDVICRTVNYMQIGATHFQNLDLLDPAGTIKTRNFFVKYDRGFNLLSQQEIIENLPRERQKFRNVEGLEDCRIFTFNDSTWFTCTTLDTNYCGQPQVSLCKLEDDRSRKFIHVEKLIPFIGPDPCRCEKNWLPFLKDNKLHVIYSYDPFIVYQPDIESEFCLINQSAQVQNDSQAYDFSRFSGSAPPIEFDDGYLLMVHETVYDGQRYYLHRFVYLDKNFKITQVSKPFFFLHKGVEYCCGITLDHSNTKLVMAIGIEDREAYLCITDLETIRSMLESL